MTKTILCYGDSNTHGTPPMQSLESTGRFPKHQRWPHVMEAHLGEGFEVVVEGLPGRNTCFDDPIEGEGMNGLRLLHPILRTHQPIDLVIIMLGTNDLKVRFNAPAQDTALAIGKLVELVRHTPFGPGTKPPRVLIAAPVPIMETGALALMFEGGAAKSRDLASHLQQIAKRDDVPMIDLGDVAKVDPLDGVHLSAETHDIIGRTMAAKVVEIFD